MEIEDLAKAFAEERAGRYIVVLEHHIDETLDGKSWVYHPQLYQADPVLDEIIFTKDPDFVGSGLKAPSVLRLSRLAVLDGALLVGSIGSINMVFATSYEDAP